MSNISFPKMFNKNKNNVIINKYDINKSIHESLTSLLSTNPGELLGDPQYGCGLKNKLFDIKNYLNTTELRNIITISINKYIPQILVNESDIQIYSNDNNSAYKINIKYKLKNNFNSNEFEIIF